MYWPIALYRNGRNKPPVKGKVELDIDRYFYMQGRHDQGTPGEMYKREGWRFDRPGDLSPLGVGGGWWQWGN